MSIEPPFTIETVISAALHVLSHHFAHDPRWTEDVSDWLAFAVRGHADYACGRDALLRLAAIAMGDPGMTLGISPEEFGVQRRCYVDFTPGPLHRWPRLQRLLGMPPSRPSIYRPTELEALATVLWIAVEKFDTRAE